MRLIDYNLFPQRLEQSQNSIYRHGPAQATCFLIVVKLRHNTCDEKPLNEDLENLGNDPGTSHMRSGRSTIWANSPPAQRRSIRKVHIKALTKTQLLFQPRPEKKHQGTTKYKTQLVNPKLSLFKWKEERKNNGENFEQIRKDDNWLNPTQLQEVNYGWISWMSKTYLPIPFAKKIKATYVIFRTSKHC